MLVALLFACVLTGAEASAMSAPIVLSDDSQIYEINGHADVLDDPGGNLDIDDAVRSKRFHAAAIDNQPPTGGVRWYRFRLSPTSSTQPRLYVVSGRASVALDLYEPRAGGGYSHVAFGYSVPFSARQAPGRDPATLIHEFSGPLFIRARAEKYPQKLFLQTEFGLRTADEYREGLAYPASVAMLVLAVVVGGLGAITRSRPYWLLAVVGLSAAGAFALPSELPMWLPQVSPPPVWMVAAATFSAYLVAQAAFYYRYLALDKKNAWLRYGFFGMTALVVLVNIAPWIMSSQPAAESPVAGWSLWIESLCFVAITLAALRKTLRGDRAAWFVLPGSILFALTTSGYSYLAYGYEASTDLVWQAFVYAVPFNMLMLIFGVGDRVRQTVAENERLQRQRDTAQDDLIDEQRRHIADIERRNETFSRFMPREFLAQLDKADVTEVHLGDHIEREMAILFADIRGFTALSERLSPQETFELLNAYLAQAGPIIRKHGGFVDKYIGDGILALFPEGASPALDAAIALQAAVRHFNDERSRQGHEPISVGIGINFGDMLLGTIGESERYETTVIADSVNVAARLEALTRVFGVSIIASGSAVEALSNHDSYCLRPLGHVALRGHESSTDAYEVFDGDSHGTILRKRKSLSAFCAAVAAFENAEYDESARAFEAITAADAHDSAAVYLRDQSRLMLHQQSEERNGESLSGFVP